MTTQTQDTAPSGVEFRPFSAPGDYEACLELQKLTWGRDFSDAVPMSILKITQKAGGIAAGAFAPDGSLLGFVYGLTGIRGGRPFHWSHMLAIHPKARDLGLGTRLKLYQRELLLPLGVEAVEWTYDPLEARNAHLNINHLGGEIAEYVRDMYEGEFGSELARGIGTDRFIVHWQITSERVLGALEDRRSGVAERFRDAPVANPGGTEEGELPDAPRVRVEVPENIQAVKAESPERAQAWRASTRRAFEGYFAKGYRVEAYERNPEGCFYGLAMENA